MFCFENVEAWNEELFPLYIIDIERKYSCKLRSAGTKSFKSRALYGKCAVHVFIYLLQFMAFNLK